MHILEDAKCSNPADTTPSNAGVAGAGVLLSFMITAGLALILSIRVAVAEFRGNKSSVQRRLLSSYSDSQLLQGIGIQSVGLAMMNTLVPYHFFLIWMQSLLSMSTHNATLLVLVYDYRRDWILRWIRQSLMFVNLALSSVSGIFVLQAVSKGLDDKTLPIACVWHIKKSLPASAAGLSYAGTIIVIIGNSVIFALATWFLQKHNRRSYVALQSVGLLLMTAVATGAAARICLSSQAFGRPSVALSDEGEKLWSFGQLLSLLVLLFPLLHVVEMYRDEDRGPPAVRRLSPRVRG